MAVPKLKRSTAYATFVIAFGLAVAASAAPPAAAPLAPARPDVRAAFPPAAAPLPAGGDDEGEPKLSLPTEADRDAWLRERLSAWGSASSTANLVGLEGAPSGRLRWRDRCASACASMPTGRCWRRSSTRCASSPGGLDGLRFAGTIDPDLARDAPSVARGRLRLRRHRRGEHRPARRDAAAEHAQHVVHASRARARRCRAAAASASPALARAEWTVVLGPRAATSFASRRWASGPAASPTPGNVEADTGQAIVRRQWWPHAGATVGWGITWR